MRKILLPALLLVLTVGCKDDKADAVVASTTEMAFDFAYKGEVSVGKTDNVAKVLELNKAMVDGDIDKVGTFLADSVYFALADGFRFAGTRDSALAVIREWRQSVESIDLKYTTAIPVDNKTAGDEWVLAWMVEKDVYKNGQVWQRALHETYLMKDGKVYQVNQYAAELTPPAPAKK